MTDKLFLKFPVRQFELSCIDDFLELNFFLNDSEQNLKENKKNLGEKWRYFNLKFKYKLNKHYFRMNTQVNQINFEDYIIFFGCSFTFGLGLPLEDTYAYLVSKELDKDYINAGVCGSSVDYVFLNCLQFLTNVNKLPKLVIINWPPKERTFYWDKNNVLFFGPRFTPTNNKILQQSYLNFSTLTEHLNQRILNYKNILTSLCSKLNVKYCDFTWCDDINGIDKNFAMPPFKKDIDTLNLYYARDLSELDSLNQFNRRVHPGVIQQVKTKNYILQNSN